MTPSPGPRNADGPKVAVVVEDFPQASETFILAQVAGMLDAGLNVQVIAEARSQSGMGHPEVTSHDLMSRTLYAEDHWLYKMARRLGSYRIERIARRVCAALVQIGAGRHTDVFVCHFGPVGERLALLKRWGLVRGRLWTYFHGYDLSRTLKNARRKPYGALRAHGDLFLPVSTLWRDKLIQLGFAADRIVINGMGVDCDRFAFRAGEPGAGPAQITSVGRLVEKKGFIHALVALADLRRRAPELDWRYVLIGDGGLRPTLEMQAKALGIADRVQFLGAQASPVVARQLALSTVFVLPSVTADDGDMETIPVVLKEAMACGVPVISTYHGGIPELVEDEVSGLLAPERDAGALSVAIERVLKDAHLREHLSREGRRTVETRFDNARLVGRLVSLIQAAAPAAAVGV